MFYHVVEVRKNPLSVSISDKPLKPYAPVEPPRLIFGLNEVWLHPLDCRTKLVFSRPDPKQRECLSRTPIQEFRLIEVAIAQQNRFIMQVSLQRITPRMKIAKKVSGRDARKEVCEGRIEQFESSFFERFRNF